MHIIDVFFIIFSFHYCLWLFSVRFLSTHKPSMKFCDTRYVLTLTLLVFLLPMENVDQCENDIFAQIGVSRIND